MKKFLICAVAILFAVSSFAQSGFGVKAGFNFNSMSDIDINNYKATVDGKTGFHAGILYKAKLPLGFAIQPELLYSQKNSTIKPVEGSSLKGETKLGYLQLPVGIQWGVDLMLFRPFLQVVPYIGYAVSTKNTLDDVYKMDFNKFQYGIGFGAGLEVWKFQLSGRYCWDLGNVADFSWRVAQQQVVKGEGKNRGFELSLALIF